MKAIQTEYCAFVHKIRAEIQCIFYWYDGFPLDSAVHLMELPSLQSTVKPIFLQWNVFSMQQKQHLKRLVCLFIYCSGTEFLILPLLNSRRIINFSFIYHSYQTIAIIGDTVRWSLPEVLIKNISDLVSLLELSWVISIVKALSIYLLIPPNVLFSPTLKDSREISLLFQTAEKLLQQNHKIDCGVIMSNAHQNTEKYNFFLCFLISSWMLHWYYNNEQGSSREHRNFHLAMVLLVCIIF